MKQMNYLAMFLTWVACSFASCSNNDELPNETSVQTVWAENDDLIERKVATLSSNDAMKVAKLFSKDGGNTASRSTSTKAIKDIQTVSSETGEPLMFVVNYADNQGYVVVGATKNYAPVLAYSEQGNISAEDDFFAQNTFFNEYKAKISTVVNEEIDSLRQRYALSWAAYEKAPEVVESRTYSDAEIEQKKAEARTYYENLGYSVHPLASAAYLIPAANGMTGEERGNAFTTDICNHTAPGYDCMDVTLFLIKRINHNRQYLATNWHQESPYSIGTQYGIAGCAPIAVAQLMKFFAWPTNFNWSNIRTDWVGTASEDEQTMITAVRNQMSPTYYPTGTGVTPEKMIAALNHFGYNVLESYYNHELAVNYILEGIPFLISGIDNSLGRHIWVCDGYKHHKVQYAAYMINRDEDEYWFHEGMTDLYVDEYFHMIFCLRNTDVSYNGWYYHDAVAFGGCDFSLDRKVYKVTPVR